MEMSARNLAQGSERGREHTHIAAEQFFDSNWPKVGRRLLARDLEKRTFAVLCSAKTEMGPSTQQTDIPYEHSVRIWAEVSVAAGGVTELSRLDAGRRSAPGRPDLERSNGGYRG